MPDERLMIFGASTRAAARSALRAGFRPVCADHFADQDLFESAEVLPLSRYPHGLVAAAASGPAVPWMYTGALENHPRVLKQLALLRRLYGNTAEVVGRVRNPFVVARVLTAAGLPPLPLCSADQPPPRDGRWLLKPRRSAGGRGIHMWDDSPVVVPANRRREPCYFQLRVSGDPYSALYLATSTETVFVGASRQLIGESRLNAAPFAYCGSVGPLHLGESVERQLVRYGQTLGTEFGLRGLFGVDFMLDADSVAWLIEVNPRYTASVEVLETALGISLLGQHVQASSAFDDGDRSRQIVDELQSRLAAARRSRGDQKCGKAVLYAPFALRTPPLADLMRLPALVDQRARIADRPLPGTIVPARAPLCTLLLDNVIGPTGTDGGPQMSGSWVGLFEPALSILEAQLAPNREA
ncbi:MAG TPA: ATP-grasp domain-containing protein [Planctomycetaceae bacterium]|nr:ATP-grasp domain-containing protein [Planctomycetaceae bacterium]